MRTYLVPVKILDHRTYVEEERRYVRELSEFFTQAKKEADAADDLELMRKLAKIIDNLKIMERSMTNRINFLEELATDVTHLQNKSMEIGEDINSMLRIVEE